MVCRRRRLRPLRRLDERSFFLKVAKAFCGFLPILFRSTICPKESLTKAESPNSVAGSGPAPHNKHATRVNGLAHIQSPLSQSGGGTGGSLMPCMVRLRPRGTPDFRAGPSPKLVAGHVGPSGTSSEPSARSERAFRIAMFTTTRNLSRPERNEMRWNRMRFHLISFARTGHRGSTGHDGSG